MLFEQISLTESVKAGSSYSEGFNAIVTDQTMILVVVYAEKRFHGIHAELWWNYQKTPESPKWLNPAFDGWIDESRVF